MPTRVAQRERASPKGTKVPPLIQGEIFYFSYDAVSNHARQRLTNDTGPALEVRDVDSLREHHALTLRRWLGNLAAGREETIAEARRHRLPRPRGTGDRRRKGC
jgi:cyclopropane fatty-acyl-phospholipid synthase-like methyltransferase